MTTQTNPTPSKEINADFPVDTRSEKYTRFYNVALQVIKDILAEREGGAQHERLQ